MNTGSSPPMLPLELTLIVAATRQMGIGAHGTLPWTGLRKEMAYFARVTKRLPSTQQQQQDAPVLNAVIMGRKTWDSIPPKFRPLRGRLNIVISRSYTAAASAGQAAVAATAATSSAAAGVGPATEPVRVNSLQSAIDYLSSARWGPNGNGKVGKVFVIGGAQVYASALGMRETKRILLTRVLSEFECDTVFPLKLGEEEEEERKGAEEGAKGGKWIRRSKEKLDSWTGETVPEGVQEENGTRYEFQMWEKMDS